MHPGDSLAMSDIRLSIDDSLHKSSDSLFVSIVVRDHRVTTECGLWVYFGDRPDVGVADKDLVWKESASSARVIPNGSIKLHLHSAQTVEATVFGLDGRLILRMGWGRLAPGYHELALPAVAGSAVSVVRIRTAEATHHLVVSRTAYRWRRLSSTASFVPRSIDTASATYPRAS